MPTWETVNEWDAAQSESGVVHASVSNTELNDATTVEKGQNYTATPFSSNLVALYPFHDGSGPLTDFGPNGYDATLNGATTGASGVLGRSALSFGGSDSVTAFSLSEYSSSVITFYGWFYPTDVTGSNGLLEGGTSDIGAGDKRWEFAIEDGAVSWLNHGSTSDHYRNVGNVNANEWSHIGLFYDQSTVEIYINGSSAGSQSVSSQYALDAAKDQVIGQANASSAHSTWYYNGRMAELHFHNGDERSYITDHYNLTNTDGTITTAMKTL